MRDSIPGDSGEFVPGEQEARKPTALGMVVGANVLDVQPTARPGEYVVRVRFEGVPALTPQDLAPFGVQRDDPGCEVSATHLVPFTGDGATDIQRFIDAADPRARVRHLGEPGRDRDLRTLTAEERCRMLASTVLGDALLSVVHRGETDEAGAVEAALASARLLYVEAVHGIDPGLVQHAEAAFDQAVEEFSAPLLREN